MDYLHLSDLHFSHQNAGQRNFLKEALFHDLGRLGDLSIHPQILIISGDLVHDPDEPDVYLRLYDIVSECLRILGLSFEQLVVCLGNHDVSRVALRANSTFRDGLAPHAGDAAYISEAYADGKLTEYARRISKQFFEFSEYCANSWPDPFYNKRTISGRTFICLNSTLFCSESGSREDRGKLLFPIEALERALLNEASVGEMYAVLHHPLAELNEAHTRIIGKRLRVVSKFVYFGHAHDALPIKEASPQGDNLYLQSGALYEKNDYFKGYSIHTYEPDIGASKITYRVYQEGRAEFDTGISVVRDGVFYPTVDDKARFINRKPKYTKDELIEFLRKSVLPVLEKERNQTVGDEKLRDVYVFPSWTPPITQ